MTSLFKKINNLITGKIIFILGAIFALSYAFMNTIFISLFSKESKGITYIENMIRYNSESLYKIISNYGSIGRNAYVKYSISFDFIFPLICSLFFISFTIYLFKKIYLSAFWQKAALVVGICFCFSDWIENILLIIIVYSFPQKLQLLSNIVSFITLSKSFISLVFFAIVIIGSFILFGIFIKKRRIIEGENIKLTVNLITIARIFGAFLLLMIKPMSGIFYIVYALCGISDILDGFLARKYNVTSKLGATLDSIADFVLVAIMLLLFIPIIAWERWIVTWLIIIACVRFLSLAIGFIKFHALAFLHTYTNKATGAVLFLFPFLYKFVDFHITVVIVCSIASLSAIEELIICIKSKQLNIDMQSIFDKSNR